LHRFPGSLDDRIFVNGLNGMHIDNPACILTLLGFQQPARPPHHVPVAMMVRSFHPEHLRFPDIKPWFPFVKSGIASRPKRRYTGPLHCSIAAMVASLVCVASQGEITVMFGRTLMMPMSSNAWCVAPSGPTETPAWHRQ